MVLGEEIFQPELLRCRTCPGVDGIAAESVDGHDAVVKLQLAKLTKEWQTADEGCWMNTHSMVGNVAARFWRIKRRTTPCRERGTVKSGGQVAFRSVWLLSTVPLA